MKYEIKDVLKENKFKENQSIVNNIKYVEKLLKEIAGDLNRVGQNVAYSSLIQEPKEKYY